jgi:hypothetical protein
LRFNLPQPGVSTIRAAPQNGYIHRENIARYQKLIAISEGDPNRDEVRHQTLLRLLAEEKAKDKKPPLDS